VGDPHAEGLEPLSRRAGGPAPRLYPVRAHALSGWPAGASFDCDHAGLYLLVPAMVEIGLDARVCAARYPGTSALSSFHSICSHFLIKCCRRGRVANAFPLGADPGLGLLAGLSAIEGHPPHQLLLPGQALLERGPLEGLGKACRGVGLYDGEAGFNSDFLAVAITAKKSPSRSTTCPRAHSAPAPC